MSKISFVLSAVFALLSHQVPVHARFLKRAQPGAEAEERARKFDNFANVYAFNWARTQAMAETVRDVYVSGDWDRDFDSKTKLFFPQRLAGPQHAAEIQANLKSRVPIYFGGGLYFGDVNFGNYVQTLRELNGGVDGLSETYGAEMATAIVRGDKAALLTQMARRLDSEYYAAEVKEPVRFGVCGPVRRIGANNHGTELMYVSHIWGINLEGTTTADYMRFTEGTGTITKRDEYAATFREILTFAFEGAAHAARTESKLASLRIPKVSLGQFLNAIHDQDSRRFAHEAFYSAVFELAGLYRDRGVTVVLCIQNPDEGIDREILGRYPSDDDESNVKIEKDLFALSTTNASNQVMLDNEMVTVQINAWDSHSFMGNMQSRDRSIDGYMVAGWRFGTNNANTSFLQNPIFSSYAHAGPGSEFWQVCSPEGSNAVPVAEEVPEETDEGSAGSDTAVSGDKKDEKSDSSSSSSSGDDDDEGSPSQAQAATSIQKIGRRFLAKKEAAKIKAAKVKAAKIKVAQVIQRAFRNRPEQAEEEPANARVEEGSFCGC